MKTTKFSILALAVMAGGILAASAKVVPTVVNAYSVDATFTNATVDVWSVDGAPATTNATGSVAAGLGFHPNLTVATDGSGKITGAGSLIVNSTNGTALGTPVSYFLVSVSGRISSTVASVGSPSVSAMTVKGSGWTIDSNGVPTAASIVVTFNSNGAGDTTNSRIPGILVGNIKGITPGKVGSHLGFTNQGYVSASSDLPLSLSAYVIQSLKGNAGSVVILSDNYTGRGNITKTNNYVFNVNGTGLGAGSSLTVKGLEGSYTNTAFEATNEIVFSAPTNAAITKGKIKGQAVISPAASTVSATLVTGY
jgi:hypothetical protein